MQSDREARVRSGAALVARAMARRKVSVDETRFAGQTTGAVTARSVVVVA